jgi:metallo-beta-lactamase family protein
VLPSGLDPTHLDFVLLTHAHLDHCGRLPLLTKAGYQGPIHATSATIDLTKIILRDSAKVQMSDTERTNSKRAITHEPLVEPLYTAEDVQKLDPLFRTVNYNEPLSVAQA